MEIRDYILALPKTAPTPLHVPEWNTTVHIRVMSGAERDKWDTENSKSLDNIRARYACLVVCDAQGERIFKDEDAPLLGRLDWLALDRVWDAGQKHNKQTADAIEEAKKNS
jgi:hypothetical protein